MAAKLLQLPEADFVSHFERLLGKCPIVRDSDYVGASTARRSKAAMKAAHEAYEEKLKVDKAAILESRARTERLEKESQINRSIEGANSKGKHAGTGINDRSKSTLLMKDRVKLEKSKAAVEAEAAAKKYFSRMRAHLNSSPSFNASQVELIVQRFQILQTSYISQLSLEDIDEIGQRMLI